MAKKPATLKSVETIKHDADKRKNIPTAEHQSVLKQEETNPVRVAYERRNRDLDPQLVWRGKDEQDWSDLVVHAPPLYIQEKVHPKVLIDDLLRQTKETESQTPGFQTDLFSDFNGIPKGADKTEFYAHDQNWSNRMILGDSLQVMASLAEREGLRGKVQCIYFDPPYGIKFNSNFQWSTTSRDVKDGKADHITREPEQVKAFRDTWRDGIHSYLTYLRDRLTVARDLLTDSGSIFVQIGDENVHRVKSVMDEVFGEDNFIANIVCLKTSGQASKYLSGICDYVLMYGKDSSRTKYRSLYQGKVLGEPGTTQYVWLREERFAERRLTQQDATPDEARVFAADNLSGQGIAKDLTPFEYDGIIYNPGTASHWKPNYPVGMSRLAKAQRLKPIGKSLMYRRYLFDFNVTPISNIWNDVLATGLTEQKVYVVQTSQRIIERCILLATDPGDLVLDPTCGSGTTATVSEQWGRRWITIDTSRVALALARARIMGARYPFYLLADSREGQVKEAEVARTAPSSQPVHGNIRHGFVYERVPHITLKSIANNAEIDVIWDNWQSKLEPLQKSLNKSLKKDWQEWEIPREADAKWPEATKKLHADWWQARIARQQEIDKSIATKAEFEFLYDKPYDERKKVRVAGPFTVESLSPHRVLGVDEEDELIDPMKAKDGRGEYGAKQTFPQMILENLKIAGVQQAHKEDRITFISLTPWPGELVCAEGRYQEGKTEKRAAIFIGPEFGTVQRADLVAAAREAGDAGFDVLIACAFNYEAHATEFNKLGRIPVLKARMNADLHMAEDLKNTGKGNLFVIFGEPDITVTSGQWLVARNGRMIANYEHVKELSGFGGLEEINRAGRAGLSAFGKISNGGKVRADEPSATRGSLGGGEHRGRGGAGGDEGVSPVSGNRQRLAGGDGNVSDSGGTTGSGTGSGFASGAGTGGHRWSNAQRSQTFAALQGLTEADFPLSLTTDHRAQVTVHGVDVFKPQTGEVESCNADGIACWFVDTDYNMESFFVRHAYFLGANDPYGALKTTLKAEINAEAWATLNSDTSRPFDKPKQGRIAVKVINHLGDEVMKVFKL
jgi:adenine-specific DNA-methyltransferase